MVFFHKKKFYRVIFQKKIENFFRVRSLCEARFLWIFDLATLLLQWEEKWNIFALRKTPPPPLNVGLGTPLFQVSTEVFWFLTDLYVMIVSDDFWQFNLSWTNFYKYFNNIILVADISPSKSSFIINFIDLTLKNLW